MNKKELSDIANVLRRDVLKMTTAAGSGHPTSCLSCAEIMSCLFFSEMKYDVKNPRNENSDEFIMSKGHAAPILYSSLFRAGAIKKDLMKLRKLHSPLEGHPMPNSFDWVKVATGSLGQGLSVGVGMALAAKKQGKESRTYVLMGDSELAEGSIYEALQLAEHYKLKNLCAIVDVNRLGQRGETMLGHDVKWYAFRFSSFGWNSIVVDGHNVKQLLRALKKAKRSNKPTIILAQTYKGKGVSFIENKEDWHGKALNKEELKRALLEIPEAATSRIKIEKPLGKKWKVKKKKYEEERYELGQEVATRDSYGAALSKLAKSDSSVLAIDSEVSNSTKSEKVKETAPKQFIETYIAEQNMAGVGLGMSKKGFNVFCSTFAAFLSRAHDQIRMSALSSADMTFCGSHCGVSIGEDGASQMGLEDIAMFRALPNSSVFYPSDAVSTEKIVREISKIKGIKYIRTTRGKTPVIYSKKEKFPAGEFKAIKKSSKDKVVLVGSGITLHECLKAHDKLKEKGIDSAVIDLYCIKPFNGKKFLDFVKKHGGRVVVVEDNRPEGGIGEMISKELAGFGIKINHLAVRDIPRSGKPEELLRKYCIDCSAILKAVKDIL